MGKNPRPAGGELIDFSDTNGGGSNSNVGVKMKAAQHISQATLSDPTSSSSSSSTFLSTSQHQPSPAHSSPSRSNLNAKSPQANRVASLRGTLPRRRSSYPPTSTTDLPLTPQSFDAKQMIPSGDLFAQMGMPELSTVWTPVGWETLLNFDGDVKPQLNYTSAPIPNAMVDGTRMVRVKSDSGSDRVHPAYRGGIAAAEPAKMAQFGNDMAWKTILASQVEVEGVGQVGVARVLQEVWRRGGGDQVTSQGLWPSIIISLSLPEVESPGFRLPTPSAHAALSLQNLYNLTLRHWEPSIFTGLLSSFGSPTMRQGVDLPSLLGAVAQQSVSAGGSGNAFGVSTPQKELDMSQWTNLTPGTGGDWNFLDTMDSLIASSSKQHSNLSNEISADRRESAKSTEEEINGLEAILAQMQEGLEAREVAAIQEQMEARSTVPDLLPSGGYNARKRAADEGVFHMPTPDTDSSDITTIGNSSGSDRQASFHLVTPPSSNGSPLTAASMRAPGGQSAFSRTGKNRQPPTSQSALRGSGKKNAKQSAMQVAMPVAKFVPPPPMCMFFSPAFHDLQNGKIGVWKGDLEVRGKGGGKFSVLIVGEAKTGHLWQPNMWPSSVVYPPEEQATDATATATMIPVSHLAREGFTPAAMGMVLCNDANIEAYVQMVQGLHSEGVAFHLSTPTRLPIVFLPAKFDSNDPLQRLGVAFMTKPGLPQPTSVNMVAKALSVTSNSSDLPALDIAVPSAEEPKKKKRRQSAPAGTLPLLNTTALARQKKREGLAAPGMRAGIAEEASDD